MHGRLRRPARGRRQRLPRPLRRATALARRLRVRRPRHPWPDSDVDLLLVATDLPDGLIARNDEFEAVRIALGPRVAAAGAAGLHPMLAPIFKTRAELERGTPLLLDMTEDARIPHDPSGCLANTLERLRRPAAGARLPAHLAR